MTNWADLTPWFLAMTGVFTTSKGFSKLLAASDRETTRWWASRLDFAGDISTGLVAFGLFIVWVTQYANGISWVLAVLTASIGLFVATLFVVSIATSDTRRKILDSPQPNRNAEAQTIS